MVAPSLFFTVFFALQSATALRRLVIRQTDSSCDSECAAWDNEVHRHTRLRNLLRLHDPNRRVHARRCAGVPQRFPAGVRRRRHASYQYHPLRCWLRVRRGYVGFGGKDYARAHNNGCQDRTHGDRRRGLDGRRRGFYRCRRGANRHSIGQRERLCIGGCTWQYNIRRGGYEVWGIRGGYRCACRSVFRCRIVINICVIIIPYKIRFRFAFASANKMRQIYLRN
ncbi:hypothetical protein C8R45DRAFT_164007 [Mycena sanguinolenta]|nr:hypothetical protein C8R45DRAFT_164007 [Mycena sanguinolenta]